MNLSLKKYLKILLPILLGVFLIWYSLSKVPLNELLNYFKNANYGWILLGMFCGLLSHLSRAYRWQFLLEPLGYKVKLGNSIMAVFSAYLINYTIPRAGEVARASILTTYEGVPFEKGFGTIVSERVADLLVMVGVIIITLFIQFDFIYQFFIEKLNPLHIVIGLIVLSVIAFLGFKLIKTSKSAFALKIKTFVLGLLEGVLSIFKMKKKWAFIAHTFFIWGMYIVMFYVTSFSLTELNNIPFGAILIGFISASFSIAATNGGIGSYPIAVYAAFSLFAIPESPSIAFGWIAWTSQTLLLVLGGGLSLMLLPIFNKKSHVKISNNKDEV
ncbi:lysylphosphatidylglycerol synthase transmembrane domain-containing protein [Xanthomarina sp. F2636L]|uniref:lysylphosphatidylglycerol synthase transmembrane domain-containing protein n=1 Tax=Xanthomarina sp. F2636L TaxID=2996018 RepID=UPI00225E0D41|nr:lysylphosphatidylglycerol synthase transmembrane domain-containing protein [Xanthomarina sp. F2636L]MCX7551123.1 lysylphosphatidylglycerol synthase transmembrane domain-containing protein [Xanthomarina sp. F2636L]